MHRTDVSKYATFEVVLFSATEIAQYIFVYGN